MNIFLEELRKTRKKLWLEYSVSRLKIQNLDLITMRPHSTIFGKILGMAVVTVICLCLLCKSVIFKLIAPCFTANSKVHNYYNKNFLFTQDLVAN